MFFPSHESLDTFLPLARLLAIELLMPWKDGKGSQGEERHKRSVEERQLFVQLVFYYLFVAFLLVPYKKAFFFKKKTILAYFSSLWPPCPTPPPLGSPALWSLKLLG